MAFAEFGVEATYVVMTENAVEKGIIDATRQVRTFLRARDIHDYGLQLQGEHRRIDLGVVLDDSVVPTKINLYKPPSKPDPRLWVLVNRGAAWSLPKYAGSGNLLAIFALPEGQLYLVNVSDETTFASRHVIGSPLHSLLTHKKSDEKAARVLAQLCEISRRGFIESAGNAPNSVGVLLEALLSIERNNRKTPDIDEEIEVKGSRISRTGRHSSKVVLFGEKPDWTISPMRAADVLNKYGYVGKGAHWRLANTQSATPNSQGMFLRVPDSERVVELVGRRLGSHAEVLFRWDLEVLEERLLEKHPKTYWVGAISRRTNVLNEEFHYVKAQFTRDPMVANLGPLIQAGKVVLELSFKRTITGGESNHGFNWRMDAVNRHLLFPPLIVHDLLLEEA
ncbi:MvaI/BcnI family restriction endonuclease [Nocardioides alpinus]|uniref:MvaI/BcnI restriction endonuclease domain-containing protein n=1 Tax=Nocardioides alpinus TaxID=748909 RepID=A0ABX4QSB7_9ACTN|nr:MvaI/BcnI family restriction endonuclease [Nocardioides alpinus]PKH37550.1 hypothetical protein CXG46_19105 [Nocardioides alpinus]